MLDVQLIGRGKAHFLVIVIGPIVGIVLRTGTSWYELVQKLLELQFIRKYSIAVRLLLISPCKVLSLIQFWHDIMVTHRMRRSERR